MEDGRINTIVIVGSGWSSPATEPLAFEILHLTAAPDGNRILPDPFEDVSGREHKHLTPESY